MDDLAKRTAAAAALAELPAEGVIGLGSGTTVRYFIEAVGALVAGGRRFTGVPTSEASRDLARAAGIPLVDDAGPWAIDVTVDGADEIDDDLHLIKGAGGALTREKIVNQASRRNVIIADATKRSARLGERSALPIEVLAFGHATTARQLAAFGAPVLRVRDGVPVRTDGGNPIYDVRAEPIAAPGAFDRALRAIPGVVETGLFVGRADVVLVATGARVERLARR